MKNRLPIFFGSLFFILSQASFSSAAASRNMTSNTSNTDEVVDASEKEGVQRKLSPLKEILQFEIDAAHMISQAISSINSEQHKKKLIEINEQYEKDIRELSHMITEHGGTPPAYHNGQDFTGFFMQGYVAVRGLLSDQGAIQALHTNTKLFLNAFERVIKDPNLSESEKSKIKKMQKRVQSFQNYFERESNA